MATTINGSAPNAAQSDSAAEALSLARHFGEFASSGVLETARPAADYPGGRATVAGVLYESNGSNWVVAGAPAGSNKQMQVNNAGAFGAAATWTYDTASQVMTIGAGTAQAVQFYERTISESIGVLTMRSATLNTPTAWDVQPNGSAGAYPAWIHVLNSDLPRTDHANWQACIVGVSANTCFVGADFGGSASRLNLNLGGSQIRFRDDALGKPGSMQFGRFDSGGLTMGEDGSDYTKIGTAGLHFAQEKVIAWSSTAKSLDAKDIGLGRSAAGVVEVNSGTAGTLRDLTARNVVTPGVTVASLVAAATAGQGARAFVSDATATTFLSTVAGGGANKVPVVSDGTNWLIG